MARLSTRRIGERNTTEKIHRIIPTRSNFNRITTTAFTGTKRPDGDQTLFVFSVSEAKRQPKELPQMLPQTLPRTLPQVYRERRRRTLSRMLVSLRWFLLQCREILYQTTTVPVVRYSRAVYQCISIPSSVAPIGPMTVNPFDPKIRQYIGG